MAHFMLRPIIDGKYFRFTIVFNLAVLIASHALSGEMHINCKTPLMFTNAEINTVIQQFKYIDDKTRPLSTFANELSVLIQLDALCSQAKFSSVGTTQLDDNDGDCDPDSTFDRLFAQCEPGHALIFVFGSIFEDGGDFYIQTNVQLKRKNADEVVSCRFPYGKDNSLQILCRLPMTKFGFPPRKITPSLIMQLSSIYKSRLVLREDPNESSPVRGTLYDQHAAFSYIVDDIAANGWLHIQPTSSATHLSGWIHSSLDNEALALRQVLPELTFIDGCAAYLKTRIEEARGKLSSVALTGLAQATVKFQSLGGASAEDSPEFACLQAMLGISSYFSWNAKSPEAPNEDSVYSLFKNVGIMFPNNADAFGFELASEMHKSTRDLSDTNVFEKVHSYETKAFNLDPSSQTILSNLKEGYEYVSHRTGSKNAHIDYINHRLATLDSAPVNKIQDIALKLHFLTGSWEVQYRNANGPQNKWDKWTKLTATYVVPYNFADIGFTFSNSPLGLEVLENVSSIKYDSIDDRWEARVFDSGLKKTISYNGRFAGDSLVLNGEIEGERDSLVSKIVIVPREAKKFQIRIERTKDKGKSWLKDAEATFKPRPKLN